MLLNSESPKANHPTNINVKLKEHQLAMLQKCIDIEQIENNTFGVMSDKPGTGKTYAILALINYFKTENEIKQTNIIIVPQNIYSQWVISIEKFGNNLTYNKFINYENIISLYLKPDILVNNDIILTTSSYYHIIATTLSSLNIKINRIFFDEIDSISNIIATKIDTDFIWFVSASFNIDYLGYYGNKIKNYDINSITCKCENDFIDENIYLESPIKKYYLCKNIYIDNILESVVTRKELKGLNAMNFTLNKKEFEQNKVNNEKEVINLILKNRTSIIDFNKFKIEDSNKNIEYYKNCLDNIVLYYNNYKELISGLIEKDKLIQFKEYIVDFISKFQEFISLNVFKDEFRQKGIQSLKIVFDDIVDICYNINEINRICTNHLENKKTSLEIDMIIMNIKKLNIIIGNVLKTLNDIKEEETVVYNLYENLENNKNYFDDLLNKITKYTDSILAQSQIDIYNKQLEISQKLIDENKNKIDLIYTRLMENKCCPICYEKYNEYDKLVNDNSDSSLLLEPKVNLEKEQIKNNSTKKIYYTSKCCNNKICENCINEWYKLGKESCIFCNTSNILLNDLIYCYVDENEYNNNLNNIDNNLINQLDIQFETYDSSKADFLNSYIEQLNSSDKKIIIFSDYSSVFQYIETLCEKYNIKYVDLDKGNIKEIDNATTNYKYGDTKILLSNSTLFGCGMNFENSSDILFVHKMDKNMEKQVIGRAQRMGRKSVLNIIYLEYENESEFTIKINKNSELSYEKDDIDDNDINNELYKYYQNKQITNILDNIQEINFNDISGNEIVENETMITSIDSININNLENDYIDVNLDELINSLT
jgi:superfamily II DNA or RNA helicase